MVELIARSPRASHYLLHYGVGNVQHVFARLEQIKSTDARE
jgi:hypothetical protein